MLTLETRVHMTNLTLTYTTFYFDVIVTSMNNFSLCLFPKLLKQGKFVTKCKQNKPLEGSAYEIVNIILQSKRKRGKCIYIF